ncbi:uncharacterized protein LOC126894752 isoform X2 [Daktulosphaira vitifoliae]|nr:uncharacterized protein LOC126894752 isoform X2 [Daktulosphaira vitifoliae]XP_050521947.1 uncharacterized protein LOC126894752 isoform X2 [Daktulosphaira vitifoliae]
MITFGQHYAITLAAHHHKTKQLHDEQYNHQTHHNTSPGGVNILLGGVMMSSMILFILWMCYCCRWKDNKFETSSYVDQPQPYWIDVNPTTYYETLQWSLQQECCEIPETSFQPECFQENPPRYEAVITPPPRYDDVIKENLKKKKIILDILANNKMHTI